MPQLGGEGKWGRVHKSETDISERANWQAGEGELRLLASKRVVKNERTGSCYKAASEGADEGQASGQLEQRSSSKEEGGKKEASGRTKG
jgi:hypothetical protein